MLYSAVILRMKEDEGAIIEEEEEEDLEALRAQLSKAANKVKSKPVAKSKGVANGSKVTVTANSSSAKGKKK
jgi:hypothetical protein